MTTRETVIRAVGTASENGLGKVRKGKEANVGSIKNERKTAMS